MQYYLVLLFLWSGGLAAQDIHWKNIEQPFLRLQYQLPQGWYVGSKAQADLCPKCAVATVNMDTEAEFNMVIVASNEPLEYLEQQPIMGQAFAPVPAPRGFFDTPFLSFTESISHWLGGPTDPNDPNLYATMNNNPLPEDIVWRYGTTTGDYSYLVYFSGHHSVLERNRSTIEEILNSIQSL